MSRFEGCKCLCQVLLLLLLLFPCCREDGCLEAELEDVLQPHEVAAVAAVGPGGAPAFVLQVCVCLGLCRDMSRCVCVCCSLCCLGAGEDKSTTFQAGV